MLSVTPRLAAAGAALIASLLLGIPEPGVADDAAASRLEVMTAAPEASASVAGVGAEGGVVMDLDQLIRHAGNDRLRVYGSRSW